MRWRAATVGARAIDDPAPDSNRAGGADGLRGHAAPLALGSAVFGLALVATSAAVLGRVPRTESRASVCG
jgi:hypothetical protein